MQRAPLGSVTMKCGCILFSSQSQFRKFHVMLKETLQCSAEPASKQRELNPACKNSIRHRQAPAKDIHRVPFTPLRETSDTLERDRNSHTPRGTLEILGEFQAFSHPPPEAQRTISGKVLSLLLSGNFWQTDCCMCPTTIFNDIWKMGKGPSEGPFVKASAELTHPIPPKKNHEESCFM